MHEKGDFSVEDKVNLGSMQLPVQGLKVDTIKFVLAKLRANVWGAKIEVNHTAEPRIFNI
jgi:hypothetical protein